MNWQLRLAAAILLAFVMAFAVGCSGDSKTKVTGKVLMNGQPLSVSSKTIVTLTFAPDVDKNTQTYNAKFIRETGQYEIEIPEGSYRVICLLKDTENNKRIPTKKAEIYQVSKTDTMDIDITP